MVPDNAYSFIEVSPSSVCKPEGKLILISSLPIFATVVSPFKLKVTEPPITVFCNTYGSKSILATPLLSTAEILFTLISLIVPKLVIALLTISFTSVLVVKLLKSKVKSELSVLSLDVKVILYCLFVTSVPPLIVYKVLVSTISPKRGLIVVPLTVISLTNLLSSVLSSVSLDKETYSFTSPLVTKGISTLSVEIYSPSSTPSLNGVRVIVNFLFSS